MAFTWAIESEELSTVVTAKILVPEDFSPSVMRWNGDGCNSQKQHACLYIQNANGSVFFESHAESGVESRYYGRILRLGSTRVSSQVRDDVELQTAHRNIPIETEAW